MSLGLLFWVLMLLWAILGVGWAWPRDPASRYVFGGWLLLFLLIGVLGWQVFGAAIKG